jgi:hypothetical protein
VAVPSLELGPPTPFLASECVPTPTEPKEGGTHPPAGQGGGGVPFRTIGKNPSTLSTLCNGAAVHVTDCSVTLVGHGTK